VSHRVLLLGAGASLGARDGYEPIDGESPLPPLGNCLPQYLVHWLAANPQDRSRKPDPFFSGIELWKQNGLDAVTAALKQVASEHCDSTLTTSFETLMNGWLSTNNHRCLAATQRLLVYAFTVGCRCAFSSRRDRLIDLVAYLKPTVIVTVNYDLLLEDALARESCRYKYPSLPGPAGEDFVSTGTGDPVLLFKLHGSVNWRARWGAVGGIGRPSEADERLADNRSTRVSDGPGGHRTDTFATCVLPLDRQQLIHELEANSVGEPVVAVYGRGKPAISNPNHLETHRSACLDLLRTASISQALAVGIRPVTPDDDLVLHKVIKLLGNSDGARCVNSSKPECDEFFLRGFSPVQETLAKFLEGVGRSSNALPLREEIE
jgi:hypothetical protein